MKNRLHIFVTFILGIIYAEGENWNSTTFEYLWNKYAFNTKFREQIYLTPFEIRLSQLSYIGPQTKYKYFLPLPWHDISDIDSSAISTKIKNIPTITDLGDYRNRTLISIELDIYKYNFLLKKLNQNIIDIQSGICFNRIESINNIPIPQNLADSTGWKPTPENISGVFEYKPIIESLGLKSTFTWKPTNFFQFTGGTFLGYSIGSVYKSTGGDRYLYGAGNRWNISLNTSLVLENINKNYNYLFGVGIESGGVKLNKINDNKYGISPISGLNIYTYGWNLLIGIQYGGRRTTGDKGFRRIIEDDYIGAIERLGQFIRFNPNHPQINEAKKLIEKCENNIPYQTYSKGINELKKNNIKSTIYWLSQVLDSKDENIRTLVKFQLDKIARTLVDSVNNNLNDINLDQAEKLMKEVKIISTELSYEANMAIGQIYFAQGDILLKNGQYSRALSKYQNAVKASANLKYLFREKEKTLAKAFLSDANKGLKKNDRLFILESLENSKKVNTKNNSEYEEIISFLKNLE